MTSRLTRRALLGAGMGASVSAGLMPRLAGAQGAPAGRFTHGVASGDPLATRVMLWTRFVPPTPGPAELVWEVAADDRFATLVATGITRTGPERDYTVKVDAGGLLPGRWYAYRFRAGGETSVVGRTRTMPVGAVDSLTLALFSCSNLPFGYFHAYADAAARDDIDLAVHVGDYIYEYERGKYPSAEQVLAERPPLEPPVETVTLAHYRARYATYRTDPDLQEVHRRLPFLCIWDDHELANDAWRDGAQEHQPDKEGPWPVRLAAARQAFFEWLPIRGRPERPIHRRFDYGQLASLLLLDTRVEGRDQQFSYQTALKLPADPTAEQVAAACAAFRDGALADPRRTLLGPAQERWLAQSLLRSTQRGISWQIVGQQLQMGQFRLPTTLRDALRPDLFPFSRTYVEFGMLVGTHGLPVNQDGWGGYPAARRRLLEAIVATRASAVVLGGDTHNAWAFELADSAVAGAPADRPIAVEFDAPGVTSPGFENLLADRALGARLLVEGNPGLRWCNVQDRGYTLVRFDPTTVSAQFRFVNAIREKAGGVGGVSTLTARRIDGGGVSGLTVA